MTADQLSLVFAARDVGLRTAEHNADDWDIHAIDQTIMSFAEDGSEFSANDLRHLVGIIRSPKLIGARFNSLRMRGVIVKVGEVVSSDIGTHGKKIGLYRGAS